MFPYYFSQFFWKVLSSRQAKLILIYMIMVNLQTWPTAVYDRPNFETNLPFFDVAFYELSYWDLNEMYTKNGKSLPSLQPLHFAYKVPV